MLRNPFRNLDQKKLRRSSDVLQSQNDYQKIVNKRIFIFSLFIVGVFSIIALRLVFIQIYDNESYKIKLENYSSQKQVDATSRGQMIDRNGKVLAKTAAAHNIIYFPPKGVSSKEQWELAQKFAKRFAINSKNMTASDYQDLYIFLHTDKNGKKDGATNLLKEKELELSAAQQETLIRSRITQDMVDDIANQDIKDAFSVYLLMRKQPSNQNKVIIEDASENDVAYLTENKDQFQGFNVDLGSWKREYPYEDTFRDVLGSITTTKQGVPSELRNYYESLGYSLTAKVGKSGLEEQYESILSGTPKISDISYDVDGTALMSEVSSGKNGYDLHLSIDVELQQKVDDILSDVVKQYAGSAGREKFNKAIVVLMNPNSGEVYTMSGKYKDEKGNVQNYSSGAYLDAYQPGSVVKGATVYMMLEEGIITKDTIINDAPMKIAGTGIKQSFQPWGPVNAVRALEVSSNVFMFDSVIKLAGGSYQYDKPLGISQDASKKTFQLMRNYYSMFGLGTKTLLDVPNEANGFKDFSTLGGRLLDYSIGQYDSYTPIQLAQYASTVANGGNKVQPKLVRSASEVNSEYTVFENKTKVLSTLNGKDESLKTVQEGMRACVAGGHCGGLNNLPVSAAAKTGTAEVGQYTNASLIGYAPYDAKPKVSFACSVPTSGSNTQNVQANLCADVIMPKVLEEFLKKY
ncbi:MAG: penicillin-binding protein 2 [Longicatena sp.]